MSAQRLILLTLTTLCSLALITTSANATTGGYADECTTLGNPTFCTPGTFGYPQAVAVDNSTLPSRGNLYLLDYYTTSVLQFNATGEQQSTIPVSVPGQGEGGGVPFGHYADSLGVDPTTGDLYVLTVSGYEYYIFKFEHSGQLAEGFGENGRLLVPEYGSFGVDPSNGNLFLYQEAGFDVHHGSVLEYDSSGNLLGSFTDPGEPVGSLAVDPAGDVYAAQGEGAVEFPASNRSAISVLDSDSAGAIAVDPSTGNVFVEQEGLGEPEIVVYGSNGSLLPGSFFGRGDLASNVDLTQLAVNAVTHSVYVTQRIPEREGGGTGLIFELGPKPERPATEGAQPVALKATLHGELRGGETGYYFSYSTADSCESGSTTPTIAATGTGEKVSAEITGLEPSTEYTFCLVASNRHGSEFAPVMTFETEGLPPTEARTAPASEVRRASAVLQGELNPGGSATYYFEYGTAPCSTTCGAKSPKLGPVAGYARQPVAATTLTELSYGTTYHYWIVAHNSKGTIHGEEQSFTTEPEAPQEVETEPAVEVTSTSAKLNGRLNPQGSAKYSFEYTTGLCLYVPCGSATSEVGPLTGLTSQTATAMQVTGLTPGTTYHYWIVAKNVRGVVYGEEQTFTTVPVQAKTAPKVTQQEIARTEAKAKAKVTSAAPSITIVRTKVASRAVLVTLRTSQRGSITLAGTGLKTSTQSVPAGTHQIKIALTKAGKTARKRHNKTKLRVTLKTAAGQAKKTVTLKL